MGNDSGEREAMIFIRTDSNSVISGGHVMRCIAIAQALVEKGKQVCFLLSDDNAADILEEKNLSHVVLHTNWENLEEGVESTIELMKDYKESILLIDSYNVTKRYVELVKRWGIVGYLGSKKENLGNIDFIINYNLKIDYDFYKKNYEKRTKLLLGPEYAPLRKEFQTTIPMYREEVKNILITTGNTSKDNAIEKILLAIYSEISENIIINVVIGRMFENVEILYKRYNAIQTVHLYENVTELAPLMKKCDLAISANGTTVYELAALGIPIISFAMVEEQVESAEALSAAGVVAYCGKYYSDEELCVNQIVKKVKYFIEHNGERIHMAQKAHAKIDGNGCRRIQAFIEKIKKE